MNKYYLWNHSVVIFLWCYIGLHCLNIDSYIQSMFLKVEIRDITCDKHVFTLLCQSALFIRLPVSWSLGCISTWAHTHARTHIHTRSRISNAQCTHRLHTDYTRRHSIKTRAITWPSNISIKIVWYEVFGQNEEPRENTSCFTGHRPRYLSSPTSNITAWRTRTKKKNRLQLHTSINSHIFR